MKKHAKALSVTGITGGVGEGSEERGCGECREVEGAGSNGVEVEGCWEVRAVKEMGWTGDQSLHVTGMSRQY